MAYYALRVGIAVCKLGLCGLVFKGMRHIGISETYSLITSLCLCACLTVIEQAALSPDK